MVYIDNIVPYRRNSKKLFAAFKDFGLKVDTDKCVAKKLSWKTVIMLKINHGISWKKRSRCMCLGSKTVTNGSMKGGISWIIRNLGKLWKCLKRGEFDYSKLLQLLLMYWAKTWTWTKANISRFLPAEINILSMKGKTEKNNEMVMDIFNYINE